MNFKLQQTYPSASQGISSFNTLTYVESINSLLLYGLQKLSADQQPEQPKKKISFKANKDPAPPTLDKISIFSLESRSWEVLEAKGKIPTPRENFASLQMGKCLVIYGGKSNGKDLNEVYALNTETMLWKKLFIMQNPPASPDFLIAKISQTSACLYSGGSLWILELADVKWQLASNELPGGIWTKSSIQISEKPNILWFMNEQELLLVGNEETKIASLQDNKIHSSFSFSLHSKLNSGRPKFINFNERILVSSDNSIKMLQYQNEGKQAIEVMELFDEQADQEKDEIVTEKAVHCIAVAPENKIFYLDAKGELISISFEASQQNTTRLVGNSDQPNQSPNNNKQSYNCIEEEQEMDQSSSYLMHHSDSQVRIPNEVAFNEDSEEEEDRGMLMRSHDSPLVKKNKVGKKNEEVGKRKDKGPYKKSTESEFKVDYEESEEENDGVLKSKLGTILTHEHLKRRLLEEKASALEKIIKKSQKFVLLLCKYGEHSEKMRHIEKVRQIKQELQVNWGKENYFRKEMEGDRIPVPVRNVVEKIVCETQRQILDECDH